MSDQAMVSRGHSRAASTSDYGALSVVGGGPGNDTDVVGGLSSNMYCKRKYGHKRQMTMKKVMETLLNREIYWFSSVSGAGGFPGPPTWRTTGTYDFRYVSQPVEAGYFSQIALPVYVFRLNVPIGTQMNAAVANVGAKPVIAFRLLGYRKTAETQWFYRWVQAPPTNNGTSGYSGNVPIKIMTEGRDLASPEIYQEYAKADVLVTGAGVLNTDISVDIVRFNNDYSAPPDLYYTSSDSLVVYSKNSGSDRDYGTLSGPDLDDDLCNSKYYNTWLARERCHPLANGLMPPGYPGSKPFSVLRKCRCAILPKTLEVNQGQNNQIRYTVNENVYHWHNTQSQALGTDNAAPGLGPDGNYLNINAINTSKFVGIFPKSTQQRWLMVSSLSRLNNAVAANAFDSNWDATFDIRIQSAFSAPVQPFVTA